MNKIILTGRLTKNAELSYLPSVGTPKMAFSLAVERNYQKDKNNKKVDFINCEMLTSVILPNTITRIGGYKGDANVFANCIALKSINLPVSLELIGVGSFMNCTNLKELVIPESLTSIRNIYIKAFKGCSNLPLATQAKLKQLGYRDTF